MTDEISISLEETNAIRKQLGLKLIEPQPHPEPKITPKETSKTNDDGLQFIDTDRIGTLRKRLASLRNTSNLSLPSEDDDDWLSKIKPGKRYKRVTVTHEDEPEEELPSLSVSHRIDEIAAKNGTTLTLKEGSILDEGTNGILENVELAQSQKEQENVRLKKLNKRSNLMPLKVSSLDLDSVQQPERGDNRPTVVVGGENKQPGKAPTISDGKIKVKFNDEEAINEDEHHHTDFQPIKIKKRSKKDVKSRIKLPSQIKPVVLIDEDDPIEDIEQQRIGTSSKALLKNRTQTPHEIARQIQKEKAERKDRSVSLNRMSNHSQLVIDENMQFLESLKKNIIADSDKKEEPQDLDQGDVKTTLPTPSTNVTHLDSETPDFSTGLASTLHFLQKRELVPSSSNVSQDDNTEITLVYRHENGVQLTTKEAYKRLSQKFHGTRSNKKKKEKFESKLRARQRNIIEEP